MLKRPIGVFDSGVGGLSILQALRLELPNEDFVYLADSAYAPYGERPSPEVLARTLAITRYLHARHHIQALVIACNSATAVGIQDARALFPDLPLIGVEPALKPAVAHSATHHIGVMATRATLNSPKFKALLHSLQQQATLICQPCDGLADAIERDDAPKIRALCADYTRAIGQFGIKNQQIDTLVMGCTHYPFARDMLAQLVGPDVCLLDNGSAIARQTRRLLPSPSPTHGPGQCHFLATGDGSALQRAAQHWLNLPAPKVTAVMV